MSGRERLLPGRSGKAGSTTSRSRPALLLALTALLTAPVSAQGSIVVGANVNMVSGESFPNGDPYQRQQNEPSVAFSSRNSLHLLAGANDYRAVGVNGMFYYSGIVFERSDPSRSAIFVSRFIDLNNDEGGDPIRYIDTVLLDTNDDGTVFLDKSWIGVDIPRGSAATKAFSVVQRDGSSVAQSVECGNLYVGYAAIGGEGPDLRSEIRLATSDGCWTSSILSPTVCNFSGAAPSLAQFLSVLSNLDLLLIRGEYSLTLDVGGLDNAELVE